MWEVRPSGNKSHAAPGLEQSRREFALSITDLLSWAEVKPGQALRQARRGAGLSQRDLATRAGVAQPAIARIESCAVIPRVDTMDRLLRACGRALEVGPLYGEGIDRTAIRELLKLTPKERLELAAQEANNLSRFLERARVR